MEQAAELMGSSKSCEHRLDAAGDASSLGGAMGCAGNTMGARLGVKRRGTLDSFSQG